MTWDFNLSQIFSLLLRTSPFLLLRMLVYSGITLAYIASIGTGSGIGWVIGRTGGIDSATSGGFIGALLGLGIISGVMYWAREYLLYIVKAGHIAVLVELLEGKDIPQGRGQIEHAKHVVQARFVESSVLFGVDRLISGILRTFNRAIVRVANILPIPGVENVAKFAGNVISMSLTYVDEVILAYNIRNNIDNPWAGARDGLVLYAQNYKLMLKNALWITLITWGLTGLIFLIIVAPVALIASLIPSITGFWTVILAGITAWGIKAALIDPLAMTALLQTYFQAIQGQQPNPEWATKLGNITDKFKTLSNKATEFVSRPRSTQ